MLPILALLVLSLSGAPHAVQGASSVCKDKTISTATGRGTCSGHGGVDAKATAAAAKAAKTAVTCTDGTSSAGGRGACSSHGGIAKAASAMTKGVTAKTDTAMKKAPMAKGAAKSPMKAKPME